MKKVRSSPPEQGRAGDGPGGRAGLGAAPPQVAWSLGEAATKVKSRPEFEHEWGEYHPVDIGIYMGDEPPGVERELTCPGTAVIYSSWVDNVETCEGVGEDNFVLRAARDAAFAAAEKISCPKTCTKRVSDLWRGWECGPEGTRLRLLAAVEIVVVCQVEY